MAFFYRSLIVFACLLTHARGHYDENYYNNLRGGFYANRALDAFEGPTTPAPTRSPAPSRRPTNVPSVSPAPSLSTRPSLTQVECNADTVLFPFCYNGQNGGRFGLSACVVISSDEFCGRYTFGVAGQEFSSDQDIAFRCGGVWEWFFQCIEDSFPTCRRTNEGVFRNLTPTRIQGPFKKGNEFEIRIEGFDRNKCSANCNEGQNRWRCTDRDEAEGIIEYARWVAGFRNGDKKNPSAPSLYEEPDASCITPAPSESLVPTESPAPTSVEAPACDANGLPEYIPRTGNVFDQKGLPGGQPSKVSGDCTYISIPKNAPQEKYDEPLPWLLRSAELIRDTPTLTQADGDFTGLPIPVESWVLDETTDPPTVVLQPSVGFTGTLRWEFTKPAARKNKPSTDKIGGRRTRAKTFFEYWTDVTENNPAVWLTDRENNLSCGSGPFCFDDLPKIRCSIDLESEFCGEFDFITDAPASVAGTIGRTPDAYEWFRNCVETAYVNNGGTCTTNPQFTDRDFLFGEETNGFITFGSDTANWKFDFRSRVNKKDFGRVQYICEKGEEGQAKIEEIKRFYDQAFTAGFFKEEPSECTEAPTASPTICAVEDSFFSNPPLNIALVLDVSFSTFRDEFGGKDIGDQNNDGKENTILDASIKASKALLNTILEVENLFNNNTNIGLILFDTIGNYTGNFNPLNDDNTDVNPELIDLLEGIRTAQSVDDIFETNRGWTNMDAGLDSAIEYFADSSKPAFDDPFKLMVFLGDGKPTVMGDGDDEEFCTTTRADCSKADASTYLKCSSESAFPNECNNDPLRFCVRGSGSDTCIDQEVTKRFDSELLALDDVARVAIGVGINADVGPGSALELIDNDPVRINFGLQPRQVLDANDLVTALRDLCPQSTPSPTDSPSAPPTDAPSESPTVGPTAGPTPTTASPTSGPTSGPTGSPTASTPGPTATTSNPTSGPTSSPTVGSTPGPTVSPTAGPTSGPTVSPTAGPTSGPTGPTISPSESPSGSFYPSSVPTIGPTSGPTVGPTSGPTASTSSPTAATPGPSSAPTSGPTSLTPSPTAATPGPSSAPTSGPTSLTPSPTAATPAPTAATPAPTAATPGPTAATPAPTAATPGPTAATPGPTSGPTVGPTPSPTVDIQPRTTTVPTTGPTNGPTNGPTPEAPPPCEDDIVLTLTTEDGTPFENLPLEIVSQQATSVTLRIRKPFVDVAEFVYVRYFSDYQAQCVGFEEYEGISETTITAQCMEHQPVTLVNVFVSDDAIVQGGAEVPQCCHGPDVDYPVVKYSFKVYCVTKCTPGQSTELID